jgi:uncharacterized protein (DUF2062 family)
MNPRRWLHEHSLKLLAIRDTPEAIAGGVAIGIFFGFTPLFGVRLWVAIFLAWLTRCNILAAVFATALHDIILPLMPVVYLWQYKVGFWLLNSPHRLPPPLHKAPWESHQWRSWTTIYTVGKDTLLGSVVCMFPIAVGSFFFTKGLIARHQRKKQEQPPTEHQPESGIAKD